MRHSQNWSLSKFSQFSSHCHLPSCLWSKASSCPMKELVASSTLHLSSSNSSTAQYSYRTSSRPNQLYSSLGQRHWLTKISKRSIQVQWIWIQFVRFSLECKSMTNYATSGIHLKNQKRCWRIHWVQVVTLYKAVFTKCTKHDARSNSQQENKNSRPTAFKH